jgi:archaellum component FlaF (FlaF/FlaG flagellin family)
MRTLYFYSADTAGNVETVHSQVLKTDVTSPTAPADVATTTVSTSTATLAWTAASDAVSGFDRYEVFLDGAYVTSASSESAILINLIPSTPYSVQVQTVDKAGNRSALSAPVSFVTDGLTTTPYTTVLGANPLDPDGANDWYVTTPTVTLAALPMSGGPRTTYFSWTDAAGPYTTYTDTLTPSPGDSQRRADPVSAVQGRYPDPCTAIGDRLRHRLSGNTRELARRGPDAQRHRPLRRLR